MSTRITDQSSIFTAEARALLFALEYIEVSVRRNFVIYSDSFSCLQAVAGLKTDHPILEKVILKMNSLATADYDIHLCWVPGHAGILGNERADRAARKALNGVVVPCRIPHSDLKPLIFNHIKTKWQQEWDNQPATKLYHITPSVGKAPQSHAGSRRDQVVLTRCRIGHSYLTHVCLLKGEPFPECIGCQCPQTLKHILLECTDFMALRHQFYIANSMQDLFTKIKEDRILDFLRAAGLYHLL